MTRLTRRLAPLALLLVALAAAWWWSSGDAAPRLEPNGAIAAADSTRAERSGERGEAGASGAAALGKDAAIEAARAADAIDPLAPPEPHEIDAIESEGRALFWGVVIAPDSKPCAGATIWHDGNVAATSDEQGRYRITVEQRTWDEARITNRGFEHWLHARKAGVGVAQSWCGGGSWRVDFVMRAGCAVSGRVRQRGSDAPVAGARVEFHQPMVSSSGAPRALVSLEMTSDADGRFAFDALMGGRIALRATADEWASCGWFEFDIDRTRGRHGIDFELEPLLTAKGWFVPWPPDGVERGDAAKAQVAAIDAQIASPTTVAEPERTPIAEDGTFRVRFAATAALELRLELAGGIAWRGKFDLPREPRDLDLGRIELAAPARVSGELALPPGLLELGFEFAAVVDAADGMQTLRAPVGSDGRFLSPPLPPGRAGSLGILLGDALAVRLELRRYDEATGEMVGVGELAPGETRDLGRIVPIGALVAGRVVDPRGGTTADTAVLVAFGDGEDATSVAAWADAKGRWLFALSEDESGAWLSELAGRGGWRLFAARHAARIVVPQSRALADGMVERIDLVLGDGDRASGRVVDETGAPLCHVRIALYPSEGEHDPDTRPRWAWSDGDGRFVIAGIAPGHYFGTVEDSAERTLSILGELVVPCADVTLKRRSDDPADGE